ncbi:glutamate [NMDA] receptor subunit 1 isoform X1 [Drosophila ficusphila]|uniref:glutamate [NMDA] receptor subunit 1 isoform X1 n=1 Tax=Drosophila ficusphila TaxID=30025 RepID=UPI0007E85C5B|nr:glutamate [NMDA] receptor subunit 1 isoform X1 [Drosophila ficusphila]XP_017044134.1 glutamate [NMDA] receptor subunit 1 isoform X1 [Drosophila ficusphila]XP_017044135.1 glutamate [NMDA] receptor subunit 1 isoform X1 [Drosophila ficusphila]
MAVAGFVYCWLLFGLAIILLAVLAPPIDAAQRHTASDNPSTYNIGGVLSNSDSEEHFSTTIKHLNFDQQYVPRKVTYYDKTIRMDKNPIKTVFNVCDKLIENRVYAVVVSHEQTSGDLSPAAVSYTSGFYSIPVIGISSRDAAFSDKNIHVSFLRTVPPYYHQADVWLEMLSHFAYTKVIIIHSSDTDGRAILGRFQTTSQTYYDDVDVRATVELIVEFEPKLESFTEHLIDMKTAQSRVYLMYASTEDAQVIFRDAGEYNMTGEGHVWIVTEQALFSNNTPDGVLGLQLEHAHSDKGHIRDSVYVLASAIKEMISNETIAEAPKDCGDSAVNWESGKRLFQYLKSRNITGETGQVAFDDNGDRIYAGYDVINIREQQKKHVVGKFSYDSMRAKMRMRINDSEIIWPGKQRRKPEGIMIPTHLKLLTIEEKPFVYVRRMGDDEFRCEPDERPCPLFNNSDATANEFCCRGYCIDLLIELSKRINFTYDLALSPDGQFGHYILRNSTGAMTLRKEWTGLIGELVNERADMIVAPLTINPERAEYIEFSKPFKYQGITILEKKPSRSSTLVSFLQPFSNTLWILVMVSVHVVALVLYLLDRFSPFGRFKLSHSDSNEEKALNLSSAVWFAWGVLLNSGIGEGTPRSFSARVLGMVWAGFAMIIVASYTANLAAFLVLERPKTKLSGINDARLRNTMENLTCATVKGSSVDMYFRRQVELSNMYRTMEANNYATAEQAIQDVKKGKLMAFIWDSSRLEYEASKDCELVTAGELFGRSGYGIGLQKGSPWTDAVTLAILEFHESGFMEKLDKQWIFHGHVQQNCELFEKTPNTLGLKNMAGVFILVGVGIAGGVGLIIIEVIYKKHQVKKQKRLDIARHAADKWRGTIEKRKTIRASLAMQRQYNVGLNSHAPGTISLAVDKRRYPRLGQRLGPERAWPGDAADVLRIRRPYELGKPGQSPKVMAASQPGMPMPMLGKTRPQQSVLPPRYSPGYTSDVSHLVV